MGSITTGQIIYLQHRQQRLYAEAIQVIAERHQCWARPLFLAEVVGDRDAAEASPRQDPISFSLESAAAVKCYSLAGSSDILWPLGQFHLALDTEVLALMPQVQPLFSEPVPPRTSSNDHLRRFMHQLWEQFPAP